MRTEITSSPTLAAARLRAHAGRARRWFRDRAPMTRWALAVAVSVASAAVLGRVYVATPVAPDVDYLYAGQRFATDEIDAIRRALAAKHIKPQVDGTGRIGVSSGQFDEATDVVAKLDVGPRSIPEIRERANQSSVWATETEKERRHIEAREQILENMICKLDGIDRAYVTLNRIHPAGGFRRASTPAATAFVYLLTERDREIESKTVQSIQTFLMGHEVGLKHDAVTVVDKKGRHYLDADNPALVAISRTRAREEELGQKILEQLHWIKGVSVAVQLPLRAAPVEPPAAPPTPVAAPPATGEGLAPRQPSMTFNLPLELEPEPGTGPTPDPVSVAPPVDPKPAGGGGQGTVWVKVPRNYYRRLIEQEPSLEVAALKAHNEKDIRKAVEMVVPRDEPWTVTIGSILDDTAESDPLPSQVASPSRRSIPWWPLAGIAAAVAVMLMVGAYRAVASRRPAPRRTRGSDRGRYPIGAAAESGHAPSERVRELVRFNPEAAAGVLQRWIGQGGHVG